MSKNEIPKKVFEKKNKNFTTREGNFLEPFFNIYLHQCSIKGHNLHPYN
jgi:hypothetical protein